MERRHAEFAGAISQGTAEIAWAPKLVFGLVLRTPLYFVKQ
jgi:hypothetical protein